MRVALMIEGQEGVTWEQWCALADACEQHGVDTLFRSDHYISQANETGNVAHDAWTTLAGLAARTTTLRLGTLVSPATFRLPGLLANAAATVDHISGGRIELGLGAGWMEREHLAYGFPFPDTATRIARFAEQLEIVHALWSEDRVDFHGEHYTLEDAPAQPKPVQQPHPPLLVGGSGTRGTAVPAARFADEYNTPFASPDDFKRIRAKVERAANETGRTLRYSLMTGCLIGETHDDALERAQRLYGRVQRQSSFEDWLEIYKQRALIGTIDEIAEQLTRYEGCDRVMLQHLLHDDLEPVALIGRLGQQLV